MYRLQYSDGQSYDLGAKGLGATIRQGLDLVHIIGEQQLQGTVVMDNHDGLGYVIDFPDDVYKSRI